MRETAAFVQNGLGFVLDAIESYKNLLNWTHPKKTAMVYAVAIAVWLAFVILPGRIIILTIGLFEFLKKFIFGVMPPPDPNVKNGFILDNLVASIPNDEDLRVAYTNEANALQVRSFENKKSTGAPPHWGAGRRRYSWQTRE